MIQQGVHLVTVEVAFGDRHFEITRPDDPDNIQLVTDHEIWHKENMINLGIQRLPLDWEYVAWIDTDLQFCNPNWATETIHALQHHKVVQLFETAIDLGPKGEPMTSHKGFMYSYRHGLSRNFKLYPTWHPGYAWAATREAIDGLGGLIDRAALGSGDHHMALSLIGQGVSSMPGEISPNYTAMIVDWQENAKYYIGDRVGYLPGTIVHYFHGKKRERNYQGRWQILLKQKFDPYIDLCLDSQGLLQFSRHGERLRTDFQSYFSSRNEDSIDL